MRTLSNSHSSEPQRDHQFEVGISLSPWALERPTPWLFAGRLERGLDSAAELGFELVEISLRSADDLEAPVLGRELSRRGLRVSALGVAHARILDSLSLASEEAAARDEAKSRILRVIELASVLGAGVTIGGIRGQLQGDASERAAQRDRAVAAIAECARRAAALGVMVYLEPLNRYETNFVNTAAEGVTLIEELDEPALRLLLDTFHMNIEEASIEAAIREASPRLGYVQLSDSNRHAPGLGHLDLEAVCAALRDIAYGGPVVSEVLPIPSDEVAAKQVAAFWGRLRPVLTGGER